MDSAEIVVIVQDLAGVIGLPALALVVLAFFLQKKGANRTLRISEVEADVATFRAQQEESRLLLADSKLMLKDLRVELAEVRAELAAYKEEKRSIFGVIAQQNRDMVSLRELFISVIDRLGYVLSPEEQAVFERVKPDPLYRSL